MNRTQIYLSAAQQAELAWIAKGLGTTSSALIRQAVDNFVSQQRPASKAARRMAAAGCWSADAARVDIATLRREERKF